MLATSCFFYRRPPMQTIDASLPRVGLIGDSIMGMSEVELKAELQATTPWWMGRIINGGLTSADIAAMDGPMIDIPQLIPDAVIVEIGSFSSVLCHNAPNCDLETWVPQDYIDLLTEYHQVGIECIIVVNTNVIIDPPHNPINDAADALVVAGVVDHVADWKSEVDANPTYVYDSYGHPTQAGQDAFAVFVAAEFVSACGDGT
ncbi:MAG: hypothetical protein ACR2QO_25590 [Acidimicrobiales bacterium]